jgi:transposase
VAQAETAAEITAAQSQTSQHPKPPRRKPARRPLPDHLPRERIVLPSPTACPCGGKLRKLGEDVTETLERVPARWKVIQHVREKMTCRACEAITQPPAPSHPIARGRAGPQLLADVLFGKYGATCRSTGKATSTRARASSSTCRPWPTGSGPLLRR